MFHADGRVNYPFSRFLTAEFDNPHTRELVSQALRILQKFLTAHCIELAVRALEGRCLSGRECENLASLCYLPLTVIDVMSTRKVVSITSAIAGPAPAKSAKSVSRNTVQKRLLYIAAFLRFYLTEFLDPYLRSSSLRAELRARYDETRRKIGNKVSGTKQVHHLKIKSLPGDRFVQLIRLAVLEPQRLFMTNKAKPCATLLRDRAIFLLACEGLRPGTIANIAMEDLRLDSGYLVIKDNRRRRMGRLNTGTPKLKLGASTRTNSASETMIKLCPWTSKAIQSYLQDEREPILSKQLANLSRGFLFLAGTGKPIGHRSSVTKLFNRAGSRLRELSLLDVGSDPYFHDKKQYDFYGYVLRHSAATFYLRSRGNNDATISEMRTRFGWTEKSAMPQLYAKRAESEISDGILMKMYHDISEEMLAAGKA